MTIRSIALKSLLLFGLLMTGAVETAATARPTTSKASVPNVMLLVETGGLSFHHPVYFKAGSATLTKAAEAVLLELAKETASSDGAKIEIISSDNDGGLAGQRIDIVISRLKTQGFSMANLYRPRVIHPFEGPNI